MAEAAKNILPENKILTPKEIAFMGYLRACNDLYTKEGSLLNPDNHYNTVYNQCRDIDGVSTKIIQMIFGKLEAEDVSRLDPKIDGAKIVSLKSNYFDQEKFDEIKRLADMAINSSEMEYPGVPSYTLVGIAEFQKTFDKFQPVYEAYLQTLEENKKNEAIASIQSRIDQHDRTIARLQEEIEFHKGLKAKRLAEISAITGKTQEQVAEVMQVSPEKEALAEELAQPGRAEEIAEELQGEEAPVIPTRPEAQPEQQVL